MLTVVQKMFEDLDSWVSVSNREREEAGTVRIPYFEVLLLGQMSLLNNSEVAALLHLTQTADMDAQIKPMHHAVKQKLSEILRANGFVLDEDSDKVWIPPKTKFDRWLELKNCRVTAMDPESVLVSKAVKAPAKNKQLILEAIASERFSNLIDRIEDNGGNLALFVE